MNKGISWKKDEHFSDEGKEYSCTDAYAKFETAIVGVTDNNDFDFIFDHNKS